MNAAGEVLRTKAALPKRAGTANKRALIIDRSVGKMVLRGAVSLARYSKNYLRVFFIYIYIYIRARDDGQKTLLPSNCKKGAPAMFGENLEKYLIVAKIYFNAGAFPSVFGALKNTPRKIRRSRHGSKNTRKTRTKKERKTKLSRSVARKKKIDAKSEGKGEWFGASRTVQNRQPYTDRTIRVFPREEKNRMVISIEVTY